VTGAAATVRGSGGGDAGCCGGVAAAGAATTTRVGRAAGTACVNRSSISASFFFAAGLSTSRLNARLFAFPAIFA
jgi:hypothetical protein